MGMKKTALIMLGAGALSLTLAGCGSNQSDQNSAKSSANTYAPAGKDTLVRGNGSEPDSLDPIHAQTNVSASILYDIGEGLLSEDQSNKPVPGVAKSWKVSDDGLVYTFHLREDAKWSNGEPVTAADFVYAFKRAVNPKNAAEMGYKLAPIENAQAIMDSKNRYHLWVSKRLIAIR